VPCCLGLTTTRLVSVDSITSAVADVGCCRSLDEFRDQQMPLQPASPAPAAAPKLSSLEQRWWLPHVVLLCCQLAFAVMHVSSHAVRVVDGVCRQPATVCP